MAKITDIAELIAQARAAGFQLRADGTPEPPPPSEQASRLQAKLESRGDELLAFLINERMGRDGGPQAAAFPARVVLRETIAGGLLRLRVEVPAAASATYINPGQYCQVGVGPDRAYFVLAGNPREQSWDFVFRPVGRVGGVLADPATTEVVVSAALAVGFPLGRIRGHRLAVAVVGTGVAAALPIVRARTLSGDAEITRVYVGFRTEETLPFRHELESWAAQGVDVIACLSRADAAAAQANSERGRVRTFRGYVQHAMALELPLAPPASVFVVGPKAMVEAVREMAPLIALDQRDVRTN